MSDSSAVRGPDDRRTGGAEEKRPSIPTFYRQVIAELRKVVKPTQDQLVTYFFVVMAFVLVMMAMISLLDLGFGRLAFEVFTRQGQ